MPDVITEPPADSADSTRPSSALALAAAASAFAALLAAFFIRTVAVVLGADDTVRQLMPSVFSPIAVVGSLAGVTGWALVSRRAAAPRRTLGWLVPVVLGLSLIPDILLGVSGSPWSAVVTLMAMHLTIAAVVVPLLSWLRPLGSAPVRSEVG